MGRTRLPEIPAAEASTGRRFELWFPARPALPAALRPRTGSAKPKRMPPRLPPNINERRAMHPQAERKLVAYWRELAHLTAQSSQIPRLDRVRLSGVVYRRNLGVADGSGDSERLKPLMDGLVDAGVLPNDTRRYVEHGTVDEQHGEPGIRLFIEEV